MLDILYSAALNWAQVKQNLQFLLLHAITLPLSSAESSYKELESWPQQWSWRGSAGFKNTFIMTTKRKFGRQSFFDDGS